MESICFFTTKRIPALTQSREVQRDMERQKGDTGEQLALLDLERD